MWANSYARMVQKYVTEGQQRVLHGNAQNGQPHSPASRLKRVAYKIETADLIRDGYLSPIQYFARQ